MTADEALAEVWASMDGKIKEFCEGRNGKDADGCYAGYLSDASEMKMRLEMRGFKILKFVKRERPPFNYSETE